MPETSPSQRVRVNIRCNVDMGGIKNEKRGDRDVIIVPSATLPDDVVMNDILYPAAEIAKGFKTLENTLAPAGHPTLNGQFVPAGDPLGLAMSYCGAHNENVRQERDANGKNRVKLDKVIDVEVAKRTEQGQKILNAIDKGEPIHTSTGLFLTRTKANGDGYKYVASNMEFDHDAILLDEEGAATPEQGVGMMVNKAVDDHGNEIEVVNSEFAERAERHLDYAVEEAARAIEQMARVPLMEQIKSAFMGVIEKMGVSVQEDEAGAAINREDTSMADDKTNEALANAVSALTEVLKPEALAQTIGNAVTEAVKPLKDQLDAQANAAKAAEEAERAELVKTVVAGNVLTETVAKDTPIAVLKELAANAKPGTAAAINGAAKKGGEDEAAANAEHVKGFDLSAGAKKE